MKKTTRLVGIVLLGIAAGWACADAMAQSAAPAATEQVDRTNALISTSGEHVWADATRGADTNPGTYEYPYATIQAAATAAGASATVNNEYTVFIMPGNYAETIVLPEYVNLKGMNGRYDSAVISGASGTLLTVDKDTNATISGIEFASTGAEVLNIPASATGTYLIENCQMNETVGAGVSDNMITVNAGTLLMEATFLNYVATGTAGGAATHRIFYFAGDATFSMNGCRLTMAVADANDVVVALDEAAGGTQEMVLANLSIEIAVSHGSYSGSAAAYYAHGLGADKNVMSSHIHVKNSGGGGAGNGYAYAMIGTGGECHSTSNRILVEGFNNDYFSLTGGGDTVVSHFDDIVADGGSSTSGTLTYVSSFSDGDLTIGDDLTIADGGSYTHTSTATSGSEFTLTPDPGTARTSTAMSISSTSTSWGNNSALVTLAAGTDATLGALALDRTGNGKLVYFREAGALKETIDTIDGDGGVAFIRQVNKAAGDVFVFKHQANGYGELTADSAIEQAYFSIQPRIGQSVTAGWIGLEIDATVDAEGSGDTDLIQASVAGSEMFAVSSAGAVDAASTVSATLFEGPYRIDSTAKFQIKESADDGALWIVRNTVNRNIIITDYNNRASDHDHDAESADPTLFIHSVEDVDVSNQEWGSATHDGTDFVLSTGGAAAGAGSAPTTIPNRIKIDGPILITGETIKTPSATLDITAATGLTAATHLIYSILRVQCVGAGNCDISSSPQIADGTDGQILIIQGDDDTKTVQFDDGDGLDLTAAMTMGQRHTLTLMYDAGDDLWIELSRAAN